MIVTESMLTTEDNPFDPFTQFDAWYSWDVSHGYETLSYLARLSNTSIELSEADQILVNNLTIDEILEENVYLPYKKVTRELEINVVENF